MKYNLQIKNPENNEFEEFNNLNINNLIDTIEKYIEDKYFLNLKITRNKVYNRINRENTCSKILRDLTKIEKVV